MMKRVNLEPAKHKAKTPKITKCPVCKGTKVVEVRSKRSRGSVINDEYVIVSDKHWTHRGVVCLDGCGLLLSEADRQVSFDF